MIHRSGRKFRKPIYIIAGAKTIQMGSGRKEFKERDEDWLRNERPHFEQLIDEVGKEALLQIVTDEDSLKKIASIIEAGYLGNFMMPLFCDKQGHRSGFASFLPELEGIATGGIEGACASGSLALVGVIDKILAEQADIGYAMGVEEQNNVSSAKGGGDILGGGAYRKNQVIEEEKYPFPRMFSDMVQEYEKKFGLTDELNKAMIEWAVIAHENGALDPKSQIYNHGIPESKLRKRVALLDPKHYVANISRGGSSKYTDAAAMILLSSQEGLMSLKENGIGIETSRIVEIVGYGQSGRDIKKDIAEPFRLATVEDAVLKAYESAEIKTDNIGYVELHDCFPNAAIMMLEAAGFADPGKGWKFVLDGHTKRDGILPVNAFGGLISGHAVGESGIRQAVDIYNQLIGNAGDNKAILDPPRPYALSINMGGVDGTVVAIVYRKPL